MLKEGDSVDFGSSGKRVGVGWTPESAARTAVSLNSSSRIKESSKNPKIFVGFLDRKTTRKGLEDYFSQYGELSEVILMKDKSTGSSKGFGFVTFKDPKNAHKVIPLKHHLDGSKLVIKHARPKDIFGEWDGSPTSLITPKIFVGGLPEDLTKEEFKTEFSRYGEVVKCNVIVDTHSDLKRSFGFLQFSSTEAVDVLMENYYDVKVRGVWVECKRAIQRSSERASTIVEKEVQREVGGFGVGERETPAEAMLRRLGPNYGSKNYTLYELPTEFEVPDAMADSPPVFPTPLTPPRVRISNFRDAYLQKRGLIRSQYHLATMLCFGQPTSQKKAKRIPFEAKERPERPKNRRNGSRKTREDFLLERRKMLKIGSSLVPRSKRVEEPTRNYCLPEINSYEKGGEVEFDFRDDMADFGFGKINLPDFAEQDDLTFLHDQKLPFEASENPKRKLIF